MATIYVPRPPVDEYSRLGTTGLGGTNIAAVLIAQLANIPVSKPPYWKYHHDSGDSGFWQGKPNQAIPPLRMPVGGGFPFKPHFWPNNYDDASIWVGTPNRSIPETDEPVGGGFPFKPPYWKYNNDDPGIWVGGKSRNIFPVYLYANLISTTDQIPLPVNCVLIGQQVYEPGRSVFSKNLLRSIFRE